jgi:hypothetical protein
VILQAWHQREVGAHLDHLATVRDQAGGASERLAAVLDAYVAIRRNRHEHRPPGGGLSASLHSHVRLAHAELQLHTLFRDLLREAADAGAVRDDVPADQLANYCRHALEAAIHIGLHLDEIGEILALRERGQRPCGYVMQIADARLAEIDRRITEMQHARSELHDLLQRADDLVEDDGDYCRLIDHRQGPAASA